MHAHTHRESTFPLLKLLILPTVVEWVDQFSFFDDNTLKAEPSTTHSYKLSLVGTNELINSTGVLFSGICHIVYSTAFLCIFTKKAMQESMALRSDNTPITPCSP